MKVTELVILHGYETSPQAIKVSFQRSLYVDPGVLLIRSVDEAELTLQGFEAHMREARYKGQKYQNALKGLNYWRDRYLAEKSVAVYRKEALERELKSVEKQLEHCVCDSVKHRANPGK